MLATFGGFVVVDTAALKDAQLRPQELKATLATSTDAFRTGFTSLETTSPLL